MSRATRWTVEILIDEADGGTHAVARLDTSDDAHVHGHGSCHRLPGAAGRDSDADAGDGTVAGSTGTVAAEIAVAAALREVATKLSVRAHVEGGGGELRAAHPRGA
jgi:hypothetical protein